MAKEYKWRPIAPLSDDERGIDLGSMQSIYDSWRLSQERLKQSSAAEFRKFNERLVRKLSVETGIIERLYDIDRGTAEALVTNGFIESMVSRNSTDIEPARLIDILQSQKSAIDLVMDCIAGQRPLTRSVLHELHSILMEHQDTTAAIDQFGKRCDIPLLKGEFKKHPNNPRRESGSAHEYCPPVQVDSEIDNLIAWFDAYKDEDPIIVSAWLHHRFTQIHPYQDGNGRLARALTTLSLVRAGLLPVVIDRDMRADYIAALESADANDLAPLAFLFAKLQRSEILQALSIDADKEISGQRSLASATIESLAVKFGKRRAQGEAELRAVNGVAQKLQELAHEYLEGIFGQLKDAVSAIAADPKTWIDDGYPGKNNSHWYKREIVESANKAGTFVNFSENRYFVKATIKTEQEKMVFVVSLHHVGRELSGIMEVTAFAIIDSVAEFYPCSLDPFVFSYKTDSDDIKLAFNKWLDSAAAVAMKEYGDKF